MEKLDIRLNATYLPARSYLCRFYVFFVLIWVRIMRNSVSRSDAVRMTKFQMLLTLHVRYFMALNSAVYIPNILLLWTCSRWPSSVMSPRCLKSPGVLSSREVFRYNFVPFLWDLDLTSRWYIMVPARPSIKIINTPCIGMDNIVEKYRLSCKKIC